MKRHAWLVVMTYAGPCTCKQTHGRSLTEAICLCAALFFLSVTPSPAAVVFSDDFSTTGPLNGRTPSVGNGWTADSGFSVSGGGVDTSSVSLNGSTRAAFAGFTSLGAGQCLTLTFVTLEPSSHTFLANSGWVGMSLYSGGSSGTERFFFGDPGADATDWVVRDYTASSFQHTATTGAAQTSQFQYWYDTGAWTYSVGGHTVNGTGTAQLAIDAFRLGADGVTDADLKFGSINVDVSPVPEPVPVALSVFAFLAAGRLALRRFRTMRP